MILIYSYWCVMLLDDRMCLTLPLESGMLEGVPGSSLTYGVAMHTACAAGLFTNQPRYRAFLCITHKKPGREVV